MKKINLFAQDTNGQWFATKMRTAEQVACIVRDRPAMRRDTMTRKKRLAA